MLLLPYLLSFTSPARCHYFPHPDKEPLLDKSHVAARWAGEIRQQELGHLQLAPRLPSRPQTQQLHDRSEFQLPGSAPWSSAAGASSPLPCPRHAAGDNRGMTRSRELEKRCPRPCWATRHPNQLRSLARRQKCLNNAQSTELHRIQFYLSSLPAAAYKHSPCWGVAHTAAEQEISPCEAAGQVRDSASAERSPRTSEITTSVFNEEMGIVEASGLMRQDSSLTQSQAGLSLPRQMLLIHRALLLPMETEDEMSANLIKHK